MCLEADHALRFWPYPPIVSVMRAFSSITGIALLASRIACLIVIAWFVVFAVERSTGAANHQVNEVASAVNQPQLAVRSESAPANKQRSGGLTLNQLASEVTSPFDGIVATSGSEWVLHGERTLFAVLIYGFGMGFLARFVRVRA